MKKKPGTILGSECHDAWENAVGYEAFIAETSMGRVWFDSSLGEVKNAYWTPGVQRGRFGPKRGIETIYFEIETGISPRKFARQIDAWLRALAKAGFASKGAAAPSKSRARPKRSPRRRRSRTSAA
jgi:hypothetical protein